MERPQAPALAPGERLNKYGQVYNFEEWRAGKVADGTWYEDVGEWKKKKEQESLPLAAQVQVPYASYVPAVPLERLPSLEEQFPPRVLPPAHAMGEMREDHPPRFDVLPPPPPPRYPPPPPPQQYQPPRYPPPPPPQQYQPPPQQYQAPPVPKAKKGKGKAKKDDWIPLKDFMDNRKRKNEDYVNREEKVLRMSDDYQSSDDMSRRVVIFDTETTGLSRDHEIVEIAMIETIEGIKTGRYLHFFINPDGENSKKAYEIHRLTKEDLKEHPKFRDVAQRIAGFIGTASLIAHNAKFDMGMLNRGMIKSGLRPYDPERFICTAKMGRSLFSGEDNSQNGLCRRFGVDNFNREATGIHSALEDTVQLYHCFRAMIPLLEKKNLCWSMFRLS